MALLVRHETRRLCFIAIILWVGAFPVSALENDEYAVKAAFIYNFAKFIEWPQELFEDTTTPFELCIVGGRGINEKIGAIAAKKAQGRAFNIHAISTSTDSDFCHIAFFSRDQPAEAASNTARTAAVGVLTIGDNPSFVEKGGIIAFTLENNKVHFRINLDAAGRAKLRISSKLLQLADVYRESEK